MVKKSVLRKMNSTKRNQNAQLENKDNKNVKRKQLRENQNAQLENQNVKRKQRK
jgi:hypothetical protein